MKEVEVGDTVQVPEVLEVLDVVGYTPEMVLNDTDYKNLKEIQEFLDQNEFEYHKTEDGMSFILHHNNPDNRRSYQIKYVPSRWYPVASKKYKIEGILGTHFSKLSQKAELEENSFICWTKDYEWRDDRKREVLKSYWTYAANKIKTTFYARECEVKLVPTKEARAFESENCFYGKRGASLNLGLYSKKDKGTVKKGDLLMIYTFGLPYLGGKNASTSNVVEVLRVGTLKFCNAIGGASKLLSYFIRNHRILKVGPRTVEVEDILFFSDYDHNIGSSMDSLSFKFTSYSGGGFMNLWYPGTEEEYIKGREPSRHKWVMEQTRLGKVIPIANAGVKVFNLNVPKYLKENNITEYNPIVEPEKETKVLEDSSLDDFL